MDVRHVGVALGAGLLATAVITSVAVVSNWLGLLRLNFGRMLGTALAHESAATQALGWGLHFANGAALALVYREVFRRAGIPARPLAGAVLGVGHFLAAMLFMALVPRVHPRPEQARLRPLRLFAYVPLTFPGMLVAHVIYGALVGWLLARGDERA